MIIHGLTWFSFLTLGIQLDADYRMKLRGWMWLSRFGASVYKGAGIQILSFWVKDNYSLEVLSHSYLCILPITWSKSLHPTMTKRKDVRKGQLYVYRHAVTIFITNIGQNPFCFFYGSNGPLYVHTNPLFSMKWTPACLTTSWFLLEQSWSTLLECSTWGAITVFYC